MQGISQYVTLSDAPDNTRWSETLHAKLDGRSLPSDHRTLYVYDACSRYDRPALSGKTWRILPQLDESHFTNCIEALFEKKSDQNDVDECFFNANDVALEGWAPNCDIIKDGEERQRRPERSTVLSQEDSEQPNSLRVHQPGVHEGRVCQKALAEGLQRTNQFA